MSKQNNTLSVGDAFELLNSNGYPRAFVEKFLPEWWDNSLLKTSSGALQFALIMKQRLGLEVFFTEDGSLRLSEESFAVRFKHRKNTHQDELSVVKNLGKSAASIANHIASEYLVLPNSPSDLRSYILHKTNQTEINLEGLLSVCWSHGIPVLFLDTLPRGAKRMTGMIVNHNGRPSIILGFRHKHKARQLFVLAHELAHLILGHVADETLLIDEDLDSEIETLNDEVEASLDAEEVQADKFALDLIRGNHELSFAHLKLDQPTELAVFAMKESEQFGIDAGHIIVSYAFETMDWPTANTAMNFFENSGDAINCIRNVLSEKALLENISEEARSYLNILQGI
ncbi:MAG: ImmA/IrrE family metallo-endopeptidase [Pseudomonadota bacterium]